MEDRFQQCEHARTCNNLMYEVGPFCLWEHNHHKSCDLQETKDPLGPTTKKQRYIVRVVSGNVRLALLATGNA